MAREPDNLNRMRRRIQTLLIVIGLIIAALAGRLWQLQVINGEEYHRMAVGNRMRYVRIHAPRGLIFDRDGEPLAENRIAFTASIYPQSLPSLPEAREAFLERLGKLLHMTPKQIETALTGSPRGHRYEPIRVKRDLSPAELIAIEEHRAALPGVIIEEEAVRRYPRGMLAGHLIGYLGPISAEELRNRDDAGYRGTDLIGKSGIERAYEDVLRGETGSQQIEVNVFNRRVKVLGRQDPIPGADLALTLDTDLQAVATGALADELQRVKEEDEEPVVRGGAVVALDPRTGEVLAMVSLPRYDPNKLLGEGRGDYYAKLMRDPALPLVHRAIRAEYSPGSTFKVVTASAALKAGVIKPDEMFFADDRAPYGKTDWTLRHDPPVAPHGWVNMYSALEVSCNDYFWELGLRTGIRRLAEVGRAFGVGSPTGIEIFPEEKVGLMPDPEWKEEAYANYPPSEQIWYEAETMDVAIGQGAVLVTPLQMAVIYMAVVNEGTIYTPQLVQTITSPAGEVLFSLEPEVAREVPLADRYWEAIQEGLFRVTNGSQGTARRPFKDSAVPVAGKTGTTQLAPGRGYPHAWFAGYAPANDPEIVVAVLVEHGDVGESAATPVARKVFDAYFGLESRGDKAKTQN